MSILPHSIRLVLLILVRTTLRHWKQKLGSYLLLLAIVAVGVGAFNGIRQASRSASANFGLFNQAVSGQSDFLIESPTQRLSTDVLPRLSNLAGDPEVKTMLKGAEDQIIARIYMNRLISQSITEEALQERYAELVKNTPSQEEVLARHILVDTESGAEEIIKIIKKIGT